jgi:predicted phosphodiesterase
MRIFALSDVHADYDENAHWLAGLSLYDYQEDVFILAGDVSDSVSVLEKTFHLLARRFAKVAYVPGNHDLWVRRESRPQTSIEKLQHLRHLARACGVKTQPFEVGPVAIVPLLGWYDYSFGLPDEELRAVWMDYYACVWPSELDMHEVTSYFLGQNELPSLKPGRTVISFSHFLPRIDLMPSRMPHCVRALYPILGTSRLDLQIRAIGASIHVYGHSHLNRRTQIDGVSYINNALGYPRESAIASRNMLCIHEC